MLEVTSLFVTSSGAPATGLTPTVSAVIRLAGGTVTPVPAIAEVGSGFYQFSYDRVLHGDAVALVDAGSAVTNASERYLGCVMAGDPTADAIKSQTDRMTFTGAAINAYATNSIPIPSNASVTIDRASVSAVASNAPSILNLVVSRNSDFALEVTASGGDPSQLTPLSGVAIQLMVKGDVDDDDDDALLVLDNGLVGGITVADDPTTGVFTVQFLATQFSNENTFPRSPIKSLVYGIKLYMPGGRNVSFMAGTFEVSGFAIKQTIAPPLS